MKYRNVVKQYKVGVSYREESGFGKTEKPTSSQESRIVIGEAHACHRCPPEEPGMTQG
jgi:hypothetical protein